MSDEHTGKFIPSASVHYVDNKQLHNSIVSISSLNYIIHNFNLRFQFQTTYTTKKNEYSLFDLLNEASSFTIISFSCSYIFII